MTLIKWLRDQKVYILIHTSLLLFTMVFLLAFNMGIQSVLFLTSFYFIGHIFYLTYAYLRHFSYFKKVYNKSQSLEEKYLLHSCIEEPNFIEGQLLYEIILESHKSMSEKIHYYEKNQRDYKAYIEAWVHEIKTPIAALALQAQDLSEDIKKSIFEIQLYVDQSLYYAKSNHIEKDYFIRSNALKDIVSITLKNFSRLLIQKKCSIEMNNLELEVMTDSKWLGFIISQIIKNAIQYSKNQMSLSFTAIKNKENVLLEITDTGMGIHASDLPHIFEKGFTGEKGRTNVHATGIGLYLCKTLCEKMGLEIYVKSVLSESTTFVIVFPYKDLLEES